MEGRERKRTREEKPKKKTSRDKSEEFVEKIIHAPPPPPSETITTTTSTYPEDSEYTDIQPHHKTEHRTPNTEHRTPNTEHRTPNTEHRKTRERSQQRNNQEQRSRSQEKQKNDQAIIHHGAGKLEESEDVINQDENEKAMHGRHEKLISDDSERKHKSRSHPEHRRSKEHKESKETKKGSHHQSKSRPEEHKNHTPHETHKPKDSNHQIKSKSINDKLEQLEDTIRVETVKNKAAHANNTAKHGSHKEKVEPRNDDGGGTHNGGKHNPQKETNSEKKSPEHVRHGRPPKKSSPKKSKSKSSSGEKSKRSASENRDSAVKQRSSEKKHRPRKRTESHRERSKKEKKCKRCRSQVKSDPHRPYYSDSELDCANGTSRVKTSIATFGTDSDVSAMCHVFSTKGINILDSSQSTRDSKDSKDSKDSGEHKTPHAKRSDALTCEKCTQARKTSSKTHRSSSDSIRNKLISALFQRIKSLLKETEELKEERNVLNEKVAMLTAQYDKLRAREEIQTEQEHLIKEKIETLAEEMKVSNKGTFRDEVHHILKNIQKKYQTHWTEHEHKINQVQTDAENEIQSLMKNIVSKYAEIGEIKDRNEVATNLVKSKHVTEPLFISCTKTNSNVSDITTSTLPSVSGLEEMIYSKAAQSRNDLLLKIADATKSEKSKKQSLQALCRDHLMKTHIEFPLQQRQETINIPMNNFDKPNQSAFVPPRESVMPKYAHANKYNLATCEVMATQHNVMRTDHEMENNFEQRSSSEDSKLAKSSGEEAKQSYINMKQFTNGGGTSIYDKSNKTGEQGLLTKKDTREFWRHKLSQPMAVDAHKDNEINSRPQQIERVPIEKGRNFF